MKLRHNLQLSVLIFGLSFSPVLAAPQDTAVDTELADLGIEELLRMKVKTAFRKEQDLQQVPAAIFVLTSDDIRRSGATSVPEALRMVPGLNVARIGSSSWAITSRGFAGRFANKLLTMVDGQSIYTPTFGGTYWDTHGQMMLEDIDRIEVIRGPGASLWGANATNGVINIITKKSSDTQGLLASGGAGSYEQGFASLRYGDKLGENTTYRVFSKYFSRDDLPAEDDLVENDQWSQISYGVRVDSELTPADKLMFKAEGYNSNEDERLSKYVATPPFTEVETDSSDNDGASVLAKWSHKISADSDFDLQTYYDFAGRDELEGNQKQNTFDIDFQHRFTPFARNEIVWGAEYRYTETSIDSEFFSVSGQTFSSTPDLNLYTWFIQDEITLIPKTLALTAGSKFEHNDFTGLEYQPSVRMAYTPTDRQTFWASFTRAVRTPTLAEEDVQAVIAANPNPFPPPPGVLTTIYGNSGYESENFNVYEIGYRGQTTKSSALDVTAFISDMTDANTIEPTGQPGLAFDSNGVPYIANSLEFENLGEPTLYGVEVSLNYQLLDWWRLISFYTWFHPDSETESSSQDPVFKSNLEGLNPENQYGIRSQMNIGEDIEVDAFLRYVDQLDAVDVDAYTELDIRLGYNGFEGVQLSVVGQNLIDNQHMEFVDSFVQNGRIANKRGVFGQVRFELD